MALPARSLVALLVLGSLTLPASPSAAGCDSTLPDQRYVASLACTGVHPGMGLRVPSKKYGEMICTAGYVFTDSSGNRYVTFPGSCHLDFDCLEDTITEFLPPPLNSLPLPVCTLPSESEEEPYYRRSGPPVEDLDGRRIGAIVYAVNKEGVDFAIARVDPKVAVDPALPLYGGPLRLGAPAGVAEEAYSVSARVSEPWPNARTGLLYQTSSSAGAYYQAEGFLSVSRGTPVMRKDGSGVGYYVGWAVGLGWVVRPYGPALDRTRTITRLSLRLATAKLAP